MSSPIGGFMPIPLAMMIPFMAVQSMVMGDAFGRSYQYGKRKISAMTNEEFNKYTKEMMAREVFTDYKQIIPQLDQAIKDSTVLQTDIVREMLKILPQLIHILGGEVIDALDLPDLPDRFDDDPKRPTTAPPRDPEIDIIGAEILLEYRYSKYFLDGAQTKYTMKKTTMQSKSINTPASHNKLYKHMQQQLKTLHDRYKHLHKDKHLGHNWNFDRADALQKTLDNKIFMMKREMVRLKIFE